MSILQTIDLKKYYGEEPNITKALDGVTLSVEQGEFVAIVGTSGSGKSTLLNMIGGLDVPASGKVIVEGKELSTLNDDQLTIFRRRKIGFIFQQFNLLPVLTAYENIIMPLLLDRQKVEDAYLKRLTALLGLERRLSHLPHELSGGQQQRVAIARALIAKPDIIFADEPTGNLDSKSGRAVMQMLCQIREQMNKTLVIITHDPRIAEMADRRFTIIDGELREVSAE